MGGLCYRIDKVYISIHMYTLSEGLPGERQICFLPSYGKWPFFGMGTITASIQSCGISSQCQTENVHIVKQLCVVLLQSKHELFVLLALIVCHSFKQRC